jgi:glycerol-3-phosphate dehydrogenase (NAD(P)+)
MHAHKIGIIGAGSWGTTLANLLADNGAEATLWVYEEELLRELKEKRRNDLYLPGIALNEVLQYTGSLEEAVGGKQIILWVTPSQAFRKIFNEALPFLPAEAIHVSASKGIENETLKRLSEIAAEQNPAVTEQNFAVLSGPSFAAEVCRKLPTAVVVAARSPKSATSIQKIMATPHFRIYTSQDVVGVELGGALKNVIAVAAGIADGLGYGSNTRAALITRGLAEMMRLGVLMGAQPITFSGLSGIGDLVLTCTSSMSRNYTVGFQLGRGKSLQEILREMNAVAEGVFTTSSAFFLSQNYQVAMPITRAVYQILYENRPAPQAVQDLMGRELKQEALGFE